MRLSWGALFLFCACSSGHPSVPGDAGHDAAVDPTEDAGPGDAGSGDAAEPDSAVPDGGSSDAGPEPLPVRQVALGGAHSCALMSTGRVRCWGDNSAGQLGNGVSTGDSVSPVAVLSLEAVVEIAAGTAHTCALTDAGEVWCWGDDSRGQLGDDETLAAQNRPVPASLPSAAAALAAGEDTTCAALAAGTVACWGDGSSGQLVGPDSSATPLELSVPGTVVDVGVARTHVCALTDTGRMLCWGRNDSGQLGAPSAPSPSTPVEPDGLGAAIEAFALGSRVSCALRDGRVRCWGLGASSSPTHVGMSYVALGRSRTHRMDGTMCGINAVGDVDCWTSSWVPESIGVAGAMQVDGGHGHMCILHESGEVRCWGNNDRGQLGTGTREPSDEALPVEGL